MDDTFTNDETCGFPVEHRAEGSFKVTSFYDTSGNLTKTIFTNIYGPFALTLSANGKSVTMHSQPYMITFYFDENGDGVRETDNGPVFLFTVPGSGVLAMDVGRMVFEIGEIVFVAGPHDFLNGNAEALCSYLADP